MKLMQQLLIFILYQILIVPVLLEDRLIYLVADVFSRMVVGFYIGFENASYVTAMQALQVAMTDKVELCKQYGYEITH